MNYTPNGLNQIQYYDGDSGDEFVYDADGNTTLAPTLSRQYWYNAKNQLTRVKKTNNNHYYEFKYDYLGRRVGNKSYEPSLTPTTIYVYDRWNLIGEVNGSGTLQKSYY